MQSGRLRRHALIARLTLLLCLLPTSLVSVVTPQVATAAATSPVTYVHDQGGRLVGVVDPTNAATYKYDAVGNITSISRYAATTISIIQITPGSGAAGTKVLIYGTAFSPTASQNTVTFNGTPAVVSSSTATQIVTTVPAGATTGTVQVVSPSGTATSNTPFSVVATAPTITGFSPNIGPAGTNISVTGSNFQSVLTDNNALLNTTHAIVTSTSSTALNMTVPPNHWQADRCCRGSDRHHGPPAGLAGGSGGWRRDYLSAHRLIRRTETVCWAGQKL